MAKLFCENFEKEAELDVAAMSRVIAAVDDLFFAAKIRAAATALGVEVRLCRTLQSVIEAAREMNPALVIVDLHAKQFDAIALAQALKADSDLAHISLLGFFSHVQTAVMHEATAAGFDFVLPRSAFVKRLPEMLTGTFGQS